MEELVFKVIQVQMAYLARLDYLADQALAVPMVIQVTRDLPAHPDHLESLGLPDLSDFQEHLVHQEIQVRMDQQEIQVLQVYLE